ncbi:uncharacterized protein LOC129304505 [Prosopis cineraria]|uniref:uncharacterized protein LOC129304505 n=1 Tax=Prosopis cineraria TaxID=364024 RepID=UPI00240EFC28|nr:uncharacterized protein LOC129304505 [Prosopis cineraria]
MAKDRSDEKIYQAKEKSNSDDNVSESRENVPDKKFQSGIQGEVGMQFEVERHTSVIRDADAVVIGGSTDNVPAATEKANESEKILEHSPEPTSNLKESDSLSACYGTVNEATATNSGFIEQGEKMDLVREREFRLSENLTKENEDFSLTTIEASEEGEAKKILDTIDSEDSRDKHIQGIAERGWEMGQEASDKAPTTGDEQSAMEHSIKNSSTACQTDSNDNQHEEKSEATENGKYDNTKANHPPDDKDGKNVMKAETKLTQENAGAEPQITGRRTEVLVQGEKDQEVEADRPQKEQINTTEVSESTGEIQELEEAALGEVDINATEKEDAETRETKEDTERGLQKPAGETVPEVQLEIAESTNITMESTRTEEGNAASSTEEHLRAAKHVDHVTDSAEKAQKAETSQCGETKEECEKDNGVDGNQTMEPLRSHDSAMVETLKDHEEARVKHKKSHNILSGVGSKVKHSISKVKKAITGKSSHPKTTSPK